MRLMLLRHAKSEKAEPGVPDPERPLTARGRKDAARIGAYLARHGLLPDRVIVSPTRRTRETWERVAPALVPPPSLAYEDRLYEAGTDVVLGVIRELNESVHTLLLVGHNPGLHETARYLIAAGDVEARERLVEGLPTAGLAVIDFVGSAWHRLHRQSGRLERFVTPRMLSAGTD